MANRAGEPSMAPEAQARQAGVVLAWIIEAHLATEEDMAGRKSTPKFERTRMANITRQAVFHFHELGYRPYGLLGKLCVRLEEQLKVYKTPRRTSCRNSERSPQ